MTTAFRRHVEHLKDRPTAENIDRAWAIAQAEQEKAGAATDLRYAWNGVLAALDAAKAKADREALEARIVAVLRASPKAWLLPESIASRGSLETDAVAVSLERLHECRAVQRRGLRYRLSGRQESRRAG